MSVQLIKRTFVVPQGFFVSTGIQGTENDGMGDLSQNVLRSALAAKGLTFPPGAAVAYVPTTRKLVVVNTPDGIELLTKLIPQGGGSDNVPGAATPAPPSVGGGPPSAQNPAAPPGKAFIQHQLDSMICSADLQHATLQQAIQFVTLKSKKLDPDGKGINFVLSPELTKNPARVSINITLDNVPMGILLHYIAQAANVDYIVKDDGVYFGPNAP